MLRKYFVAFKILYQIILCSCFSISFGPCYHPSLSVACQSHLADFWSNFIWILGSLDPPFPLQDGRTSTANRKHATRVALSATPPLLSPVSSKCERRKLEFYQKSPNFRSVPPSTRAANDLQHPSLLPLFLSGFPTAESFSFGEREKERERGWEAAGRNPRTPAIA